MLRNFRAVILGAPGSGKGTISSRIVRKFEMKHISSGDLLRNNIINKTPLGLEVKKYMDKGQLVPDEVVIELVLEEIDKSQDTSWLLDGFPRTKPQAQTLLMKSPIDAAINLIVPFDVIIDRIEKRWVHLPSGRVYNTDFNPPKTPGVDDITSEKLQQRDDDNPVSVQKRLEIYAKTFGPLLDFYREEGILEEFSGNTSDEIWPMVYKYLRHYLTPITQDLKV
ncbi:GTP:AMP phosphotransferase AK3, mitochondrial-like [Cimex lectularius]|uniref:GTP:AMP phosphotransferase, mitochondrial n=1 Tax=Cimex lectularius TaxID=79782 RepID=A0A8I6S826_CIMLE|nr:GTP:AMP phosphotransferase AK3, mitochondrial-like [Cimex lectularius]